MVTDSSKLSVALTISDEILNDIETGEFALEQIIFKCMKLARLRDDFDAINWFTTELHGYSNAVELPGINSSDRERYAKKSGRMQLEFEPNSDDEKRTYSTSSVCEIEVRIQSLLTEMESLQPPAQFTPSVNKRSYETKFTGAQSTETVIETYQNIIDNIRLRKNKMTGQLLTFRSLLSKIRTNIYHYVLNINLQLRFEAVTESIFQETKLTVDKLLSEICPDAIKKFVAAYDRINSDNSEEWSQAMSSCRNILKEFADHVFPASTQPYTQTNGETLIVTDDKYKNRIMAFVDSKVTGERGRWMSSRISDLGNRIHSLNDLLSKGTHVGIELTDVRMCVLDTYFLIGSIIQLVD